MEPWTLNLYGSRDFSFVPLPQGHSATCNLPFLNMNISLASSGEIFVGNSKYKVKLKATGLDTLTNPQLHQSDSLLLLRTESVEIGLSYENDKDNAKLFFIFRIHPPSFMLKFEQLNGFTQLECNSELGYLSFSDLLNQLKMVFTSPIMILSPSQTTFLPIEWDTNHSAIVVKFPEGINNQTIISFGITAKRPTSKDEFLPHILSWLQPRSDGPVNPEPPKAVVAPTPIEDEKPKVPKDIYPTTYEKGIPSPHMAQTLYGTSEVPLVEVDGKSSFLKHQALSLEIGFNTSGELEFSSSPSFKVKFVPNITLKNAKLRKRDGLQIFRAEDGEFGISFDNNGPLRHFFILHNPPKNSKLCLTLKVLLTKVKLKFEKNVYLEVYDDSSKIRFSYLSPIAQFNSKTVTLPLDWNAQSNSIEVKLPASASYPLMVAFGVSPKAVDGALRWTTAFPPLRGRVMKNGEVDERPEETYDVRKLKPPSFFSCFPPAKQQKWKTLLYGPSLNASLAEAPVEETSLKLNAPSLGPVSLNEEGDVEFGGADWKGKFSPSYSVKFGRLVSQAGLILLRHGDGEIGALKGETKLQVFPDTGNFLFTDSKSKVHLSISSPLILSAEKPFRVLPNWDGSINISFPSSVTFPAVVIFGVSNKAEKDADFFRGIKVRADGSVAGENEGEEEEETVEKATKEGEQKVVKGLGKREHDSEATKEADSSLAEIIAKQQTEIQKLRLEVEQLRKEKGELEQELKAFRG